MVMLVMEQNESEFEQRTTKIALKMSLWENTYKNDRKVTNFRHQHLNSL
jgi:hypothetical protein